MLKTCDVLFVDDEKDITNLYEAVMSLSPYSFKIAQSGYEALSLIETTSFKLFVVDINLGAGMSGVDLGVIFRKKFKDAKIYAMTGYTVLFDTFAPSVAGFDAVLSKPIDYKNLADLIKKFLESP